MTTTPETTIKFDVFEHWVRSYVDDTLRSETLNNHGSSYYHEWGQRCAAASRMASLLADLFAYSELNARDTLDRLVDAVEEMRFEDLYEAGEYRFNRIMAEARLAATTTDQAWIDALEFAMDEFGVPTTYEVEEAARWAKADAEWDRYVEERGSQIAASSGTVSV